MNSIYQSNNKTEPFVSYRSRASSIPDSIYQNPSKRKINPSFVGKQIRILNTHERPRKMGYFAFVLQFTPLFNDLKPHLEAVIKKKEKREREEKSSSLFTTCYSRRGSVENLMKCVHFQPSDVLCVENIKPNKRAKLWYTF